MGIGRRLKEAREMAGLTQEELGRMIGITGSAITNYEKETSHPKEPIMYALIDALKVEPNFLFQDCVNLPKKEKKTGTAEAAPGEKPLSPPGYSFLNPANKVIADQIVEVLLKNQPQNVIAYPINSVALGGAEPKTELDSEITLPKKNTKVLSAQGKAGTDGGASVPEEK